MAHKIPIVDMKQLRSTNIEDRRRAGRQIVEGFQEFGLFHLINHGISPKLRRHFFEGLLAYARLPEEVRLQHVLPGCWGQRGWAQGEKSVTSSLLDYKGWLFANPVPFSSTEAEEELRRQWPTLHPPNYWPVGFPPGFEQAYMEYGLALYQADLACQQGCALGLGLPEETFVERVIDGPHNFRALIYFPLVEEMLGLAAWGEEHTDFNDQTDLAGGMWVTPDGELTDESPDPESGLWLRTPSGEMISGKPPPGCIVIQCGQQKETTVGGALLATPHVIRPAQVTGWMRLAGAFFTHQRTTLELAPIPGFNSPKQQEDYGPSRPVGVFDETTLHQIGLSGLTDAQLLERFRGRGVVLPDGANEAEIIAKLGYRYDRLRHRMGLSGPAAG